MKFRCERDTLADAIAVAQRAVASRTGALPVLSGLRVSPTASGVELASNVHTTTASAVLDVVRDVSGQRATGLLVVVVEIDHLRFHCIVFVAVVTGAVAAWALTAPTRYIARAQILLTPIASSDRTFDGFSVLRESSDPGRAARTAALLVSTPQVAEGVRIQLGLDQSAASLLRTVRVPVVRPSGLVGSWVPCAVSGW